MFGMVEEVLHGGNRDSTGKDLRDNLRSELLAVVTISYRRTLSEAIAALRELGRDGNVLLHIWLLSEGPQE